MENIDWKWIFTVLLIPIVKVGYDAYIKRKQTKLEHKLKLEEHAVLTQKEKEREEAMARKEAFSDGLKSLAKFYNSMEILQKTEEITRVLLLEVSNGGAAPRLGSRMHASVINVKHDNASAQLQIMSDYEKVIIDDSYINMVIQAETTKNAYVFDVANHPPCILQQYYRKEGVRYSEIFHIFTDGEEDKMFIASIATENKDERFESRSIRAKIDAAINLMRSEFEKVRGI